MIDIIEHCLLEAHGGSVSVCTWTTGIYDIERMQAFAANGLMHGIRIIVDPTVFGSKPEFSAPLVRALGVETFRMGHTHAKISIIKGARFNLVIRSSMNLNVNKRPENFDISTDDNVCSFYINWFEAFWNACGESDKKQQILSKIFEAFPDTAEVKSHLPSLKKLASALPKFRVL